MKYMRQKSEVSHFRLNDWKWLSSVENVRDTITNIVHNILWQKDIHIAVFNSLSYDFIIAVIYTITV